MEAMILQRPINGADQSPPGLGEWARYIVFEYIPLWVWLILAVAWSSIIAVAVLA
jgi:hypothetical protein